MWRTAYTSPQTPISPARPYRLRGDPADLTWPVSSLAPPPSVWPLTPDGWRRSTVLTGPLWAGRAAAGASAGAGSWCSPPPALSGVGAGRTLCKQDATIDQRRQTPGQHYTEPVQPNGTPTRQTKSGQAKRFGSPSRSKRQEIDVHQKT